MDDVGSGPVALDTPVFIYFLEQHPRFLQVVKPMFEAIAAAKLEAVTSELTLLETLVAPFRSSKLALAARYEAFLTRSRHLSLLPISREILRTAAHLRGTTRAKTPDALQLASALAAGCTSLVTGDRSFPDIRGLRVLQLVDYAPPATEVHERRPLRPSSRTVGVKRRS